MGVAIVGAYQTRFGDFPSLGIKELFLDAYKGVLDSVDKGIEPRLIEAAYIGTLGVGGFQLGQSAPLLTGFVGLSGIPSERVENACASGSFAMLNAIRAILSGEHEVVLAAGVEKMRDLSTMQTKYWLGVSGDTEYERLAGVTFAGVYALMANRYMEEYGLEKKHLSKVAVKNHKNGAQNPKAHFQREITLERAMSAPDVAFPLNLFDCCPISDGAAAVLLCSEKRAKDFTDAPVRLVGWGAASDYLAIYDRESLTNVGAVVKAADKAYRMADVSPRDIDVAEVHDCFTIAEVMAYGDLGFCERGEGRKHIEDGYFTLEGRLPVNPSGGLKSKGHPLGATGPGQACEVFHQLRGTVEKKSRHVANARIGLTHNVGGSGGSAVVFIYEGSD